VMGTLSDSEKKVIIEIIRGLRLEHRHAGISNQSMIKCDRCRKIRPLMGAARYGRYRLCNDCALDYELAKAEGCFKSIDDFISAPNHEVSQGPRR